MGTPEGSGPSGVRRGPSGLPDGRPRMLRKHVRRTYAHGPFNLLFGPLSLLPPLLVLSPILPPGGMGVLAIALAVGAYCGLLVCNLLPTARLTAETLVIRTMTKTRKWRVPVEGTYSFTSWGFLVIRSHDRKVVCPTMSRMEYDQGYWGRFHRRLIAILDASGLEAVDAANWTRSAPSKVAPDRADTLPKRPPSMNWTQLAYGYSEREDIRDHRYIGNSRRPIAGLRDLAVWDGDESPLQPVARRIRVR